MTWSETISVIDGQEQDMIYLSGYNYDTQGELDYLISPRINLAAAPNAQLKFKLAYASYPNADFQESLLVAVSTDCGNSFDLLDAPYYKFGQSLETAESTSDQFIPATEQQFRTELVNLSRYAGNGDIRIAFVAINGFGNDIYIKDIEILATEEYRYDFEISRIVAPGPINDGSSNEETLLITNTGNLPISDFEIRREASQTRSQTVVVEDEILDPGESGTFNLSANLNQGLSVVEYTILNPNYDQNPGSSSTLLWHYVRDDSTMSVPWRQNFDGPAGLGSWITLNPETNQSSWSLTALQAEGNDKVLSLSNTRKGNSYWLGSPIFDLSSSGQASIFFNWAAAGFRATDMTSLSMLLSKDGGSSYEELWRKDAEEINTLSGGGSVVNSNVDFTEQYLNLSAFTGEGHEKVRIAFKVEYRDGAAKPIYLDNIELFLSANPEPVDPGLGNTVIFPNPAFDLFNVTFNLDDYEDVNLQIISSSGKVVHDVDYPRTLNQTYTFSTSVFSRGVFIVKISGDRISATKRLIIH